MSMEVFHTEIWIENAESGEVFSLSDVYVLSLEKFGKNLGLDFCFGRVLTVPISATGTQGEQPLDDKIM